MTFTAKISCILLLITAIAVNTHAQVRVSKPGNAKSMIDLSGFASGQGTAERVFRRTLETDLVRSGWFAVAARGQGEFMVSGTCTARGKDLSVECRVLGTATSQSYLRQSYRMDIGEARRLAHRVADDIVEAVTGKKGIASTRLLMVGTQSGHKELYVCDLDGGNLLQLTRDRRVSVGPQWSPDGKDFVYTGYLKDFPDVYMVNLESGNRRRIAGYSGLNTGAAIAPNGRDVAVILSKDGNPELYVMDLRSGKLSRLTRTPQSAEASPSWSPDGRSIAYVSDQSGRPQVYVVSRSGGRPRRVTSRGSENVAPDWGPNGLIACSSKLGSNYQIVVVDPNSSIVKEITRDGADYEDPSWAPDGRHIVCSRSVRYKSSIYILDTMGDPPVALSDAPGDWYSPAWSPN